MVDVRAGRGGDILDQSYKQQILFPIGKMKEFFKSEGFQDCSRACSVLETTFAVAHIDRSSAKAYLDSLIGALQTEMRKQKFIRVEERLCSFADQEKLFGDAVFDRFKHARPDIREAGNCIAVGLPTAAVFHLMRVAEYGLRSLARRLKVTLTTHHGQNHPVDYADWEKVIVGIKNTLTAARGLAPGPRRQAKLERYSDAADHCTFMKDIWRNNISHARKPYKDSEAISVLERVRDFMQFLTTIK